MKTYEVLIKAYRVVTVVGAESESDAMEIAYDDANFGGFTHDETEATELTTEEAIDRSKRHSDATIHP